MGNGSGQSSVTADPFWEQAMHAVAITIAEGLWLVGDLVRDVSDGIEATGDAITEAGYKITGTACTVSERVRGECR